MSDPSAEEAMLEQLRELARQADWNGVRALGVSPPLAGRVEAGLLVSEAELRQGDTVQARIRLQWVTPEAERLRDPAALRRATNMLGAAHFELGELDEAEAAFERALGEASRDGDHLTSARATNNLGLIANVRGQHDAALGYYRVALPAYQRLGFTSGIGETTHNIAITLRDLGQFEEADRQERRAIEFAVDCGNRRLAAMARAGRAELALRRGEPLVARADGGLAALEFEELGDVLSEADALRIVGRARLALGDVDLAAGALTAAIDAANRQTGPLIEAESRWARAEVFLARGERAAAEADIDAARELFDRVQAGAERVRLDQWWAAAES
ncbi:MAG: tetratricopeptide repeat protein [Gemmatimonadales bacterium]